MVSFNLFDSSALFEGKKLPPLPYTIIATMPQNKAGSFYTKAIFKREPWLMLREPCLMLRGHFFLDHETELQSSTHWLASAARSAAVRREANTPVCITHLGGL